MLVLLSTPLLLLGFLPRYVRADVPELPVIPQDKSTPLQQRLGYDSATKMAVGWNTFQPLKKPTVHYGLAPSHLDFAASSHSSVTYPTSRTWANSVLLENLLPATTYYYKIESTNSSIDSFKTGRFAGDHTPFTAALVIDMGVFGEYGLTISETKKKRALENKDVNAAIPPALEHTTIDRLVQMASDYEFVLHPGDFSYADTWIDDEKTGIDPGNITDGVAIYEGLIEQFYDQLAVVSRMKPYMVGVGNHEADCNEDATQQNLCPIGQTNFTGYVNRWANIMPSAPGASLFDRGESLSALHRRHNGGDPMSQERVARRSNRRVDADSLAKRSAASLANPPFWYSFDYGMAHIVVFDTETDFGNGLKGPEELGGGSGLNNGPFGQMDQQIAFLEKDLSSVNRKLTPWVIAAGHRPWYAAAPGTGCITCQQAFEPILNKHNVDLAIFGHVHNMQRHVPTANNQTDPAGLNNPTAPWYIVTGAAGNVEGRAILPNATTFPDYVAWTSDEYYGFSLLNFIDRQHIEVQFIKSDDGTILDRATLFKEHDF